MLTTLESNVSTIKMKVASASVVIVVVYLLHSPHGPGCQDEGCNDWSYFPYCKSLSPWCCMCSYQCLLELKSPIFSVLL